MRTITSTIVALGVFDGVHLGHQALLREALGVGSRTGLPVLVVTFHPHPRTLTGHPNGYARLLTPPTEKAAIVEDCGADYMVTLPFTKDLASTAPREFVERYLVTEFGAEHVVCGFNFTFGHKGAGRPEHLVSWGKELGYTVHVVPPLVAGGTTVSSTRVRSALWGKDVAEAALCLGRPYCLTGPVEAGDGRGHRIGIPTSNIGVPSDKVLPANGVYAALVRMREPPGGPSGGRGITEKGAVVNIGTRPTFGGAGVRVECHIPGFSGDLYGREMQVFLVEHMRDEQRFHDARALRGQVEKDINQALAAVAKAVPFTLPGAYDRMLALELP